MASHTFHRPAGKGGKEKKMTVSGEKVHRAKASPREEALEEKARRNELKGKEETRQSVHTQTSVNNISSLLLKEEVLIAGKGEPRKNRLFKGGPEN